MFEFQQYLGFLLFLTILTIGFWLGGAIMELIKEKRAKRQAELEG